MQEFLKSLHALWTAQALSEGQSSDTECSHAPWHTNYSVCLDLKTSGEHQFKMQHINKFPEKNYRMLRNSVPLLSFPCHPRQKPAPELWGITDPINAAWLLISLWQNAYRSLLLSDWWSSDHFE